MYSLISIVVGIDAGKLVHAELRRTSGAPFESTTMPYGLLLASAALTTFTSPVFGSSRPTMLAFCAVNQRMPF